jgi:hypothetical protein
LQFELKVISIYSNLFCLVLSVLLFRENPQDDEEEEEESSSSSSESEAESDAEGEREETEKRPGERAVTSSSIVWINSAKYVAG